jgi:hypothetical protein
MDTSRQATIEDASACALIVDDWIEKTEEMPRLFDKHQLTEMIRNAIPLRDVWVIGQPINGYISYNPDLLQVSALYVNKRGKGLGKILLDRLNLTTNIYNCGVMSLIIRHIPFIEEKDFSSRKEKNEVRMEYRNYNFSGLENK